jgi:wyosine [tRNA(Phe)-imidazoG37] synthetase (radical SAM superfamily)
MNIDRTKFYEQTEILQEVRTKVKNAEDKGEKIDYLTFVPDGEPTLDINLGTELALLKELGIRLAVITNSSLIHRKDVRDDLKKADWISLKVDAVTQSIWKKVNRPYKSLKIDEILNGMLELAHEFKGELVTETMLVRNINDNVSELEKVASFISGLNASKNYISIPIRPPAETWVEPPKEEQVNLAFQVFRENGLNVELLIGYEGNEFAFTGNIEQDLLSITSVHPMREDGLAEFLTKAGGDWGLIERLLVEDKLVETQFKDKKFYIRRLTVK